MALWKAEEGEVVELIGCEEMEDVHGITGGLANVSISDEALGMA